MIRAISTDRLVRADQPRTKTRCVDIAHGTLGALGMPRPSQLANRPTGLERSWIDVAAALDTDRHAAESGMVHQLLASAGDTQLAGRVTLRAGADATNEAMVRRLL